MSIGAARRTQPLCRDFGGTRGTPIDRFYIEQFVAAHADDIKGHVLEIADDRYSRTFGGGRVRKTDILTLDGQAPATMGGDLGEPATLPPNSFDCIVLTQTLHLVYDFRTATEQLRSALRPGGVLLMTVPGVSTVDRYSTRDGWHWSFTRNSLRRLLQDAFGECRFDLRVYGNLYAASAFLQGACLQEINKRKLEPLDEAYPVIVAARAFV